MPTAFRKKAHMNVGAKRTSQELERKEDVLVSEKGKHPQKDGGGNS